MDGPSEAKPPRWIKPRGFRVAVTQSMMREWDEQIKKRGQPAACPGCGTTRLRVHALESHVKYCTDAEALFTHICTKCNMGFLKDHMLTEHNQSLHGSSATKIRPLDSEKQSADPSTTSTTTDVLFSHICTLCNMGFLKDNMLAEHIQTLHASQSATPQEMRPLERKSDSSTTPTTTDLSCSEAEHICTLCNMGFLNDDMLAEHIQSYHGFLNSSATPQEILPPEKSAEPSMISTTTDVSGLGAEQNQSVHGLATSLAIALHPDSDTSGLDVQGSTSDAPQETGCSTSDGISPRRGSRMKKPVNRDIPTTFTQGRKNSQDGSSPQTANEELASSTLSTAKRPRGRPRKDASEIDTNKQQTDQSEDDSGIKEMLLTSPSGIKRPPGRPRKNTTETNAITSTPYETNNQAEGSEEQSDVNEMASPATSSAKRSRGRPRKYTTETDTDISTHDNYDQPAPAEDQSVIEEVLSTSPPLFKKPRGRPRKVTETDTSTYETDDQAERSEEQTTPSSTKRPRGRPRKVAETDADTSTYEIDDQAERSEEQTTSSSTKRPRGRPRKYATEWDADKQADQLEEQSAMKEMESPTMLSAKRPRGRPRKNATATDTDISTHENDDGPATTEDQNGVKEMLLNSPPSIKRPRGRPRKDATEAHADTSVHEADDQAEQLTDESGVKEMALTTPVSAKRPRGRPRKDATETDAVNFTLCETGDQTEQFTDQIGVKEMTSSTPSFVVKRPVGRPRKDTIEIPKRPRGRPRKDAAEAHADTSTSKIVDHAGHLATTSSTKRPRGRPKKDSTEIAKRPRGRPKKHAAEANVSFGAKEKDEQWGQKEEDEEWEDEESDNASDEETITPGSRRKRKRRSMASSDDDDDEDDSEEEVVSIGYTARTKKKLIASGQLEEVEEDDEPAVETETESVPEELPDIKKGISLPASTRKKFADVIKRWEEEFLKNNGVFATCPKCRVRRRSMEYMLDHYRQCIVDKQRTNCPFCSRDFQSTAGLKYHMMTEHNSLTGKDEGSKRTPSDLYKILKKSGKLKCPNDGCGKKYITVAGYNWHVKACSGGPESILKCEKCEKEYTTKPGLRYHMAHAHPDPNQRPPTPEIEQMEIDVTSKRGKRKAAKKALKTMKEFDTDVVNTVTGKQKDRRIKKLFTSEAPSDLPPDLNDKWTKSLKETGTVACDNDGCPMTFSKLGYCRHHYFICAKRPDNLKREHKCNICSLVAFTVSAMVKHILARHPEDIESVKLGDADYSGEELEEDEEEEEDEDDDEDPSTKPRSNSGMANRDKLNRIIPYKARSEFSAKEMLKNAVKWTAEQHIERFCSPDECIFPKMMSSFADWQVLNESEKKAFEPVTLESVPFRVINSPDEDDKTFSKLQRYAVLPHKNKNGNQKGITHSSFFVGGPVWAMAWCPVPKGKVQSAKQYAVISCHRGMDDIHKVNILYTGPGLVQLWAFGELTNKGATAAPHLCMNLAHDYGCVWDLKWCPSGCWQDPEQTSPGSEVNSDSPGSKVGCDRRMGLLGLACSDGTVRVICVLHPCKEDVNIVSTYKPKPVLSLLPSMQHGHEAAAFFGQCWCLEWLPRDQHTRILAGFSNGTIAIWDLVTTSLLLQKDSLTEGKTLYPVQIAHLYDTVIRSLSWCPLDPNFVATVCVDRSVSLWDLRDLTYPVMTQCFSLYVDCKWLSHWGGFFASNDNSIIIGRSYSYVGYFECGFSNFPILPTTAHKSCVWGLDVSDWINALVSVDAGGNAEFMLMLPMDKDYKETKAYVLDARRRFLYYTELKKLSNAEKKTLTFKSPSNSTESQEGAVSSGNDGSISVPNRGCNRQGNLAATATDLSQSCEGTGKETIGKNSVENTANKETVVERSTVEETEVARTPVEDTDVEMITIEETGICRNNLEEIVLERTNVEENNVRTRVEETDVEMTNFEEIVVENTCVEGNNVGRTSIERTNVENVLERMTNEDNNAGKNQVETDIEITNVEKSAVERSFVEKDVERTSTYGSDVGRTNVESIVETTNNKSNNVGSNVENNIGRTQVGETDVGITNVNETNVGMTNVEETDVGIINVEETERTNVERTSVEGNNVIETHGGRASIASTNDERTTINNIERSGVDSLGKNIVNTNVEERTTVDKSNVGISDVDSLENNIADTNVEKRTTTDNTNNETIVSVESSVERTNVDMTNEESTAIEQSSHQRTGLEENSVEKTSSEGTCVQSVTDKETNVETNGGGVITVESENEEANNEDHQLPKTSSDCTDTSLVIKTEPFDPDEMVTVNFGDVSHVVSSIDTLSDMRTDTNSGVNSQNIPAIDIPSEMRTNPSLEANLEVEDEIAQLLQVCQENLTDVQTKLATQDVNEESGPATQILSSQKTALNAPSRKSPNEGKTISRDSGNANGIRKSRMKKKSKLPSKYNEMSEDYGLVYNDFDMSQFASTNKLGWKVRSLHRQRLNGTGMLGSGMEDPPVDQFPLQALYKVCINPNFGSHFWVLTGGQAGIVRAHCMVGLNKP